MNIIIPPVFTQTTAIAKRKSGAIAGTNYVNEIADVVQANLPTPNTGSRGAGSDFRYAAIVKVDTAVGGQAGRFTAKEFDLGAARSTLSGALAEADIGTLPSGNDCIVLDLDAVPQARVGFRLGTDQNRKTIVAMMPRGFFPVQLSNQSGSQGSDVAAPTYVYDCAWGGVTIGTAVAVVGPRPFGRVDMLSYGIAFYNETGVLKLWAAEQPKTGECP